MLIRIKSHRARKKVEALITIKCKCSFTEGYFYDILDSDFEKIKKITGISKATKPKSYLLNPL